MMLSLRALRPRLLMRHLGVPLALKFGLSEEGASLAERRGLCYKAPMILKASALLSTFVLSCFAFAAPQVNETLHEVSAKYRSAKLVEMDVEKTVKLELTGRVTNYEGKISLAGGKFRWENNTPEQTLLVFDGQTIWSVQYPPKELGGNVQVARGKVDKRTRSQILISSLLGEDVEKNFKVGKESKEGSLSKVEITPKGNDLSVRSIDLILDSTKHELKELSYKDDVGNLTTMKFSNVQYLKQEDSKRFKYQPPKGAQVTNL